MTQRGGRGTREVSEIEPYPKAALESPRPQVVVPVWRDRSSKEEENGTFKNKMSLGLPWGAVPSNAGAPRFPLRAAAGQLSLSTTSREKSMCCK